MLTSKVDPSNDPLKSNSINSLILFVRDPKDANQGIEGRKWGGSAGSGATVTYSFMTAAPSYANEKERKDFVPFSEAQRTAAEQAIRLWEEVSGIDFVNVPDDGAGGLIRFGASKVVDFGDYAYLPGEQAGDGDIWLKNTSSDLLTMIHEIGHSVGLRHPGKYNSAGEFPPDPYLDSKEDSYQYTVMSYNGNRGGTQYTGSSALPQAPQLYDIAAIQYLYGANNNTRTEDNLYTWNEFTPFVETIWDGGGNDTISAANQHVKATIDLRAGKFSSIGRRNNFDFTPAQDNLAIAYGVTIEGAIGSRFADSITGNEFDNSLSGEDGDDTLDGMEGSDNLYGGLGNDVLRDLQQGTNQLYGGIGDDTYEISSSDSAITEYANEGTDTVLVSSDYRLGDNLENLELTGSATSGWGNDLKNIIKGNDTTNYLYGEGGDDKLYGEGGHDELYGGVGEDYLVGGDGNDYIDGWEDNDILYGKEGNDVLVAWKGNDVINGGNGDDWLDGSYNEDILYGGEGNDTLGNPVSAEGIGGEPGDDQMSGEGGNDQLYGGDGKDFLDGGADHDTIAGGLGNDKIVGGDNDDVLRGDLDTRDPQVGMGGGDDFIDGGKGKDRIGGKGGKDTLIGGEDDDQIWGDDGDDLLRGGLGNDTLTGDDYSGGKGRDTFILAQWEGKDIITDFQIGQDFIGLAGGLTFSALTITQKGVNSQIGFGSETLAILNGIDKNNLISSAGTFISV